MATDLAGVSLTILFNNTGVEADSNAPYTNSGLAATLTLDEVNGAGVVSEAAGAFTGVAVNVEGAGQFIFNGANSIPGNVSILGGLLSVEADGALGSSNAIVFGNGAAFGALEALTNFTTTQLIAVQNNSAATLEAAKSVTLTATGFFDITSAATLHIGSATDKGTVALGASGSSIAAGSSLSVDGGTLKLLAGFSTVLANLTGGATVNAGLDLNGQAATLYNLVGGSSGDIVDSGANATLTIDETSKTTYGGIIAKTVSLEVEGAGPLILTGQTSNGQMTIDAGSVLEIGDDTTGVTLTRTVVDNGTLEINVAGSLAYAQQLSGSGEFLLEAGETVLSGNNIDFTGAFLLHGGTLSLTSAAALGAAALLDISSGAIQATADESVTTSLRFVGAATLEATAGHTLTLSGPLADLGTLNGDDIVGAQVHIGSATDSGTVILGNNGGAGFSNPGASISIDGGTLQLANASAAALVTQATGSVTVTGTLDLDGQSVTLNNLTGAGTITNSSATAAALKVDETSGTTYASPLSGNLSLEVAGSRRLTLTGSDTVTLGTTIDSGASLQIGDGAAISALSGNVVDNGMFSIDVAGSLAYAQQLSGSGDFDLYGGDVTLSGSNSGYSGGFELETGTLSLANGDALGDASLLGLEAATVEAAADVSVAAKLDFQGNGTLEAKTGHTLTFSGALDDLGTFDDDDIVVGSQVHIGSATDSGTVILGNNGGSGFGDAGATIEIDGGTLNVQSNLSLAGVAVSFTGTAGTLILNSTTSAVVVSTAAGASGEVDLNSALVSFTGGGERVGFLTGNNDGATLAGTSGHWDTVYGSKGEVVLNGAQASVVGGADFLVFNSSTTNAASLYDTGNAWDAIDATSGSVTLNKAKASVIGGGDHVYFDTSGADAASLYNTGNAWDTVYASKGSVTLNKAKVSVVGGGDLVYFDASGADVVSLYDTAGAWDTVTGSHGAVYLTSAWASLVGSGDTAYLVGSADFISLYNTGGVWDTINGSHDVVILSKAQASVVGGGDTIYSDGATSDYASLYSTDGVADTVNAVNGNVILTSAQASIVGYGDTISMSGASTASETLTNSAFHDTYIYGQKMGVSTINGFTAHDAMQLSKADFASVQALFNDMSQSGANTIIRLDANDQITLTNIQKSSLAQSQFSLT